METLSPANTSSQKQRLALRVALDTMKDRCILQQKRINEIEEKNQQLLERLTQQKANNTICHNIGGVAENYQLRLQVSELQQQNAQLNAQNNMLSSENRKLWSRLSQIAKEQTTVANDNDCTLTGNDTDVNNEGIPRSALSPINQILIRSRTFTQHSPNPHLRHKVPSADGTGENPNMRDVSLEIEGAEEACQENGTSGDNAADEVTMGFGFLNVDETTSSHTSQEQDLDAEAQKCHDGLRDMRQMALQQQEEMKSVFALLESRLALQPCPDCVKKSQKPEMADKSLETDESFNDTKYTNHIKEMSKTATESTIAAQTLLLNINQEKKLADEANKICPMCGKNYDCSISFELFCEHVEEHFRDDSIVFDQSIDQTFEYISHTVGDF